MDKSDRTPTPKPQGGRPPKVIPGIDASFDDVIRSLVRTVKRKPNPQALGHA